MHVFWTAVLVVGLAGCQTATDKPVKLETQKDSVSYSIGMNIGKSLHKDTVPISPEAFLRGVLDATADSSNRLLTEAQMQTS